MAAHATGLNSCVRQSVREQFGEASVEQLERLVLTKYRADGVQQLHMPTTTISGTSSASFVERLPPGAVFLLAGLVQHAGLQGAASSAAEVEQLRSNATATVTAFTAPTGAWTTAATSAFGQRLLQLPESEFALLAAPGGHDHAALRFLAEVVRKNLSASEVARALQEEAEGQRCVQTFRTSPTLGAVVLYASYNVLDDIGDWVKGAWNWLEGAAQWVKDAVDTFGEWASKQAKAVVESVFSKFENATKILEEIPGVGLVVAGIYALAGDMDHANAALAINVNAIVTVAAAAVGSVLGGAAGGMAAGALGKAAGLVIQGWIAQAIKDPKLKAEVGDISATRFIVDVALAGAVGGGASAIGGALAKAAGQGAVKTFATSTSLSLLLSSLPGALVPK